MGDMVTAFGRALRSLRDTRMLWHLVWPALLALAVWVVVAWFSWSWAVSGIFNFVAGWPLLGSWVDGSEFATGALLFLIKLALLFALVPLIYVTAALLISVFAVPMMLERVALGEYRSLEQRQGGSAWGSAANATWATVVFLALFVVSLPLWLVPGFGLLVTVVLTAWLNQKAFGYDALMLHADRQEMRNLPRARRDSLWALGGLCALLAYVPVVNLLAPAFSALVFVHYMLIALGRAREGAQV